MYMNVFIGDDVTPRVQIVRQELLGIRKCLVEKGVECWIPPTLPPFICVKKNNIVTKVPWYNAKGRIDKVSVSKGDTVICVFWLIKSY